jgi:hypothetical protein
MAQAKSGILIRPQKRRWFWHLILMVLLCLVLGLAFVRWVIGPKWQEIYARRMQTQLSWYEPRYPALAPLWSLAKLPMLAGDAGEKNQLLPPGTEDRFDPTAKFAADLPARTLAAYLIGVRDGDTITLPPGRYTDCITVSVADLTLKAAQAGTAQLDGGACGGKAAIVAHGEQLTIDGLVFKNIFVDDGNGAGIRQETGNLVVKNSIFYNNQDAILTLAEAHLKLEVDHSVFVRLGRCDGLLPCSHSIYAGKIDSLIVRNSVFRNGAGGHFIKSRSRYVEITDNELDATRGNTGFLIDLPHGSDGMISGNHFFKGKGSNNRCCIIRVASEGRLYDSSNLRITGNTVRSHIPLTVFVWNSSQDAIYISDNALPLMVKSSWGASRSK